MSILSFGGKEKKELALIIDIGSASVGAAIAVLSREGKPTIFTTIREDMVFQEDLDIARFRTSMRDALAKALRTLERLLPDVLKKTGGSPPSRVYVTFSSPWHASETRTISSVQDKPFRMTEEILNRIVRREVNSFTRTELAARLGEDPSIIEEHVMRIALNGYETREPFGKEAKTLDVGLFLGVISRAILDDVTNETRRVFSAENKSFHSFPFVAFAVVRDFLGAPEKFLIVDVGGEVTDVSVVSDHILSETTTFPVGKRTLLRALSRAFSTTPDEALSLVRLSSEKRLSETTEGRIGKSLSDVGSVWVSAFEKALSGITTRTAIPSSLFISADDDLLPYFEALVKRESFAQYTVTDEMFSVFPLSSAALSGMCQFDRTSGRDPFLIMETAFANKMQTA
ncbi:MAG: hypothetical protein AAB819_03135 [Patescibacteria group bacterium]